MFLRQGELSCPNAAGNQSSDEDEEGLKGLSLEKRGLGGTLWLRTTPDRRIWEGFGLCFPGTRDLMLH